MNTIHVNAISMAKMTEQYKHVLHPNLERIIVQTACRGLSSVVVRHNQIGSWYTDEHTKHLTCNELVDNDIAALQDRGFSIAVIESSVWDSMFDMNTTVKAYEVRW